MDLVSDLLVFLHLLGMAAVVGGWLAVLRAPRVLPPVVWGARAQIVTGLLLVGAAEAGDEAVDNAKVGVKLLVALAVAACAEVANARQRRGQDKPALVHAAGSLATLNVAVAALW